jgi:ligand-binding sensor domain-containing protein/signal transduction histidine kinase
MKSSSSLAFLFIILFTSVCTLSFSQKSDVFRHLSTLQGLSHNRITCVVQDRKGYIWIGTEDGLNRYNGYKVDIYKHDPSDNRSVSNNGIRSLFEDSNGKLWIGTDDGLNVFDVDIEKFQNYKSNGAATGMSSNQITCMEEDAFGQLWIGTAGGGLNIFNTTTSTWKTLKKNPKDPSSISSNNITALAKDKNGIMYVGTDQGLAIADKGTPVTFSTLLHQANDINSPLENDITSLYSDFQNKLWIGTLNSGLSAMNTTNRAFTHFTNLGSSNNSVFGINKDLDGSILVGTIGGGLLFLNADGTTNANYYHSKTDPFSISSNNIWTIYRDKAGIIWIGTDNGLDYYKEDLMRFKTESPIGENDKLLANKNTFSLINDGTNYWMGVLGSGIVVKDKNGNTVSEYSTANGLSDNNVLCLFKDKDGMIWAGTYNGLSCINRTTKEIKNYRSFENDKNSLSNNNIRAIAEDAMGNLYIGTYGGGLNILNKKTGQFSTYKNDPQNKQSISNDIITGINYDGQSNLYIGTYGGGLSIFNTVTGSFTNYTSENQTKNTISSNFINCIYNFGNEKLLIGTYSGGMNLFNKKTKTFIQFTEQNGMPNNNITNITADGENNIWATTGNQICKVKFNSNDSLLFVRIYDEQDGVFNRFNPGSCTQTLDGKILFGGNNGLNRFSPANIKDNPYIPPVVITKFFLFEKPYYMDTIIMAKNIIELNYNQNFFAFEFASLNYILPEKNQYAYRLEGLEKEWIYCGTRRDRQYTDLDPGEYKFHVKASNNDGIWNEEGTYITIRIKPPFWKTWWFYILSALTFASLTFAYIRWRTRTLMKEYERLELKVQERTSELRDEKEKTEQKSAELEKTLNELRDTQSQLIHAEKMASLGQLTAGIAHEIQNPLNFVNNFSELSSEMMDELVETPSEDEKASLIGDIKHNLSKINEHGKRAERIVKSMLMHSRTRTTDKTPTDINKLAEDALNLSYTSLRARDHNFGCENIIKMDQSIPLLNLVQQDISRVLLNIFNNAFYAVNQFRKEKNNNIKPKIILTTSQKGKKVYIRISDNGGGIPNDIIDKIFQPFFTTKPTGEGTGLGLSLSYEIITKGHNGNLTVEIDKGIGSVFIIELPID